MVSKLVKFIPSEIRLEMAQEIIKKIGIRPLARKIGVNPKSVYKYKQGTARPSDEVMAKLLAVAKQEDPTLLENYLNSLQEGFEDAMEARIDPSNLLSSGKAGEGETVSKYSPKKVKTVAQQTTEETKSKTPVDQEPTKPTSLDEICKTLDVSDPFDRIKVEKIVDTLLEVSEIEMGDLVESTGLSNEAVEKYLDEMEAEELVERTSSGSYQLSVKVEGGD